MYYKRQYRFQFSKTLHANIWRYLYISYWYFLSTWRVRKMQINFFRVLVHHSTQYICYISTEQTGDQKSFQFRIMRFSCSQGTFSLFWVQWYRGSLALSCILLLTTCINCHNCGSSHFLPLKIKLYFSMWSLIYISIQLLVYREFSYMDLGKI